MNEQLIQLIRQDRIGFEWTLLAAAICERSLWSRIQYIGTNHMGKPTQDWSRPQFTALWKAINDYHVMTSCAFEPPSEAAITNLLIHQAETEFLVAKEQIPELVRDLGSAMQRWYSAVGYHKTLVSDGLYIWLEEQRLAYMLRLVQSGELSSREMSDQWMGEFMWLRSKSKMGTEIVWYSVDDCLNTPPVEVFLKTPWQAVNARCGGGLARGDATLIIAPTGAGKTVVASMMAGHFATLENSQGLFITTEQKGPGILPRIISSTSLVPYEILSKSRSVQLDSLSDIHREKTVAALSKLRQNKFYLRDWIPSDAVHAGIVEIVDYYKKRLSGNGKLDWIIMDWLGSKLIQGTDDSEIKRARMQAAADTIALLADELDIVTFALAQANFQQAVNKPLVGSAHLMDNKQLGINFENIWGLSLMAAAMKAGDSADDDGTHQDRWLREQNLNLEKTRFGPGGVIKVKRDYHVQRLNERT